jgi:hypothetical protein
MVSNPWSEPGVAVEITAESPVGVSVCGGTESPSESTGIREFVIKNSAR